MISWGNLNLWLKYPFTCFFFLLCKQIPILKSMNWQMGVLLNLFSQRSNKLEDLVIITNKEYESGRSVIPFWEACPQEGQRHHLLPQPPVWIDALWMAFYSNEPWTERSGNSLITTAIMILNLEDRQKVVLISFHPHLFLCLHFNYENA